MSEAPALHQEGVTLLQLGQFNCFYLVTNDIKFLNSDKRLSERYIPSLMCTLSVGMITEGYWFVVGGGVRPVLVGEASNG